MFGPKEKFQKDIIESFYNFNKEDFEARICKDEIFESEKGLCEFSLKLFFGIISTVLFFQTRGMYSVRTSFYKYLSIYF